MNLFLYLVKPLCTSIGRAESEVKRLLTHKSDWIGQIEKRQALTAVPDAGLSMNRMYVRVR